MNQGRINRNSVIIEAVKNVCDNCKICVVPAIDMETGEKVEVKARYCLDGSGYIEIDLYNADGKYLDSRKLKHPTDSGILPFDLKIDSEPDCGCL